MIDFFNTLKSQRESAGLTLEQLHQKTRLPLNYLQAIEAGKIDELPDGYERIYLRRYAKEIGLDGNQVLEDYDLLSGHGQSALPAQAGPAVDDGEREAEQLLEKTEPLTAQLRRQIQSLNLDRIHKGFWIGSAAIILLIAAYFTYKQYVFELEHEQLQVKEISISELIEDMQTQDSVLTPQLPENSVLKSEERPLLVVELRAQERTWIREVRDRSDTTEYILPTGIQRRIEAIDEVSFRLGRADGVEIWLNGSNLGLMGEADEVVLNLVLNNEGIAEKRLKRVIKKPAPVDSSALPETENSAAEIPLQ